MVCRRWYQVTIRPEMVLKEVHISSPEYPMTALPAARSLLRWMHRHGQHVRILTVNLRNHVSDAQKAEVMCLLENWMALCSSRLVKFHLELTGWSGFTVGWLGCDSHQSGRAGAGGHADAGHL
jgi:hypothetical protein